MKKFCIVLVVLMWSCGGYVTSGEQVERASEVVVIFRDAVDQSLAKRYGFSTLPRTVLSYVDDEYRLVRYNPKLIGYDTLKVPTFDGYAEVMHRYQGLEKNYYLLEAGDTVLFTYGENLRPQIESLCSEGNTWLYTIAEHDNRSVNQETSYTLSTLCTDNYFTSRWNTLNSPKYRNDKAKQEYVKQQLEKYPNVDSLKLIYDIYILDYKNYIDSLESNCKISSLYADFYRGNTKNREDVLHCDSLLRYPSAHAAISGELVGKGVEEVEQFSLDSTISKYARLSALEFKLQSNKELSWGNDPNVIEKCAEMYEELSGSSFYATKEPTVTITADAGSMVIEDMDGRQITFDKLLDECRGSVIYVDLWASWCAPCLSAMRGSEELRREFVGENIVFIYLAVGDRVEQWRAAIARYNIDTYGAKNYFVVNSEECTYLKEVDNRTIPQYLLYDTSGELTNHFSPSPTSKEIHQELRSLLKMQP